MSIETPILGAGGEDTPGTETIKNTTTQDFVRDVVDAGAARTGRLLGALVRPLQAVDAGPREGPSVRPRAPSVW